MKRLDTSFGSGEPREPYPLPCLKLITLITYLFSLLPFTCLAWLCASVRLCFSSPNPLPYMVCWLINTRQAKSNKENIYVIKVIRLNREGGTVPLVCESQMLSQAFSLVHN
jgi:hypothetical protein